MKKQCKTCEWYPNDCGYWEESYRKKNKDASFLKAEAIHNCHDHSLDTDKLAIKEV